MNSNRNTAIIVGVLFITATVVSILSLLFTGSLNAPDYLEKASADENRIITGSLLLLINCISIIGIAVMLFPVLKKHNEAMAMGYVGARILEGVFFIVGVISWLALITLSKNFLITGALEAAYYKTTGELLLDIGNWTFMLGGEHFLFLSAMILNCLFYSSRLVPRFLSVWGIIGAVLLLLQGMFGMFGLFPENPVSENLFIPIALQEMVLAVWLIARGFSPASRASETEYSQI